jgi:hypothetical protein
LNARPEPSPTRLRPERLLPLACVVTAGVLFASELMTTFELTNQGGLGQCSLQGADRHQFALGVLAIFSVGAVLVAVLWGSKPAAMAVGVAGLLALLLFLTIDLPKANNVGTLEGCSPTTDESFVDAKAIPQAGFWLEMVGALGLALSGAALATLSAEQLARLRPRSLTPSHRRSTARRAAKRERIPAASADAPTPAHEPPATRRRRATARGGPRRRP